MNKHRKIEIPLHADTVRLPRPRRARYIVGANPNPDHDVYGGIDPKMYDSLEYEGLSGFKKRYPDRTPAQKINADNDFRDGLRLGFKSGEAYKQILSGSSVEDAFRSQLRAELDNGRQDSRFTKSQAKAIGAPLVTNSTEVTYLPTAQATSPEAPVAIAAGE